MYDILSVGKIKNAFKKDLSNLCLKGKGKHEQMKIKWWHQDFGIGNEGAKTLAGIISTNKSLKSLDISGIYTLFLLKNDFNKRKQYWNWRLEITYRRIERKQYGYRNQHQQYPQCNNVVLKIPRDLTDNKINYDGIRAISEGLGKYAALRVLDLSKNIIGKNLYLLKRAFKASAAVTELNLSGQLPINTKFNSTWQKLRNWKWWSKRNSWNFDGEHNPCKTKSSEKKEKWNNVSNLTLFVR